MKRAFLVLPLVALLLIGCDDAVTDSMSETDEPAVHTNDALNQSAFGKKNDNGNGNDKGGKPGGGGNDAYPSYSNIKVEYLGTSTSFTDWYNESPVFVPSVVKSYVTGTDPNEFFGCPDVDLPCYKITVTVNQADVGDAVAVRIHPFEEDAQCIEDGCPMDTSLGDDRRKLSIFDAYLGTPYMEVDQDNPANDYVFYWQGQLLRQSGLDHHGYFRYDRDPDDQGNDLLRAEAAFFDADSGYLSGTSLMEIDQCASANPILTSNEDCVFRHEGALPASGVIESRIVSVGEPTKGRGRNKTSTTTIYVENTLNGESEMSTTDSGSDVWVVFLIDNVSSDGSRVRTVDGTALNSFTVSPQEGCLLIRPIQAQLFADFDSEFNSYFSADQNGEYVYDVDSNGVLTAAATGSECALAFQ